MGVVDFKVPVRALQGIQKSLRDTPLFLPFAKPCRQRKKKGGFATWVVHLISPLSRGFKSLLFTQHCNCAGKPDTQKVGMEIDVWATLAARVNCLAISHTSAYFIVGSLITFASPDGVPRHARG